MLTVYSIKKYTEQVLRMPAQWLTHGPRRPESQVTGIVLHATAGRSLSGAVRTLIIKRFSYHYLIDTDGKVYKCVPSTTNVAYHAGNSYGWTHEALGISTEQDRLSRFVARPSVNQDTIGIAFVNSNLPDGEPVNDAQISACIELVLALRAQFPSIRHITTHAQVSPRRKTDPIHINLYRIAQFVGLNGWVFPANRKPEKPRDTEAKAPGKVARSSGTAKRK